MAAFENFRSNLNNAFDELYERINDLIVILSGEEAKLDLYVLVDR